MGKKYILVDTSYLIFRSFYAYPNLIKNNQSIGGFFGFAKTIHYLVNKFNTRNIIFTHDLPKPTWRHKIFSEYKAGRQTPPPELLQQFPIIKEWTNTITPNNLFLEGFEADDIIKTLCDVLILTDETNEVYIFSSDRDLYQLFTHSNLKFLHGDNIFDLPQFLEKYQTKPEHWVDFKTYVGDSSDNLKGVSGIGPKTAAKLISDNILFDYIFEFIQEGKNEEIERFIQKEKNANLIKNIAQNIDSIKQTRLLAGLQFVDGLDLSKINEDINLNEGLEFYKQYGFNSLIKEVSSKNDVSNGVPIKFKQEDNSEFLF